MKVMSIGKGCVIEYNDTNQAILAQKILAQWGFRVLRRDNTIISSILSPDDVTFLVSCFTQSI